MSDNRGLFSVHELNSCFKLSLHCGIFILVKVA